MGLQVNLDNFMNLNEMTSDEFEKAVKDNKWEVYDIEKLLVFQKDLNQLIEKGEDDDAIEKAKRDLSKLHKKVIIDKRGHKTTKWVRGEEGEKKERGGRSGERSGERDGDEKKEGGEKIYMTYDKGMAGYGAAMRKYGIEVYQGGLSKPFILHGEKSKLESFFKEMGYEGAKPSSEEEKESFDYDKGWKRRGEEEREKHSKSKEINEDSVRAIITGSEEDYKQTPMSINKIIQTFKKRGVKITEDNVNSINKYRKKIIGEMKEFKKENRGL